METINKIMALLKENKKTQKELCDFLGVKKSTFTHWKTGETLSFRKYLPEIAAFFNVSIDYLLGKKEKPTGKADELIDLIADNILALDKEEQEKIIKLLSNPEKLKAVLSLI